MHPNPVFRTTPRERNVAFARDAAFGIMAVAGPDGPLMSHVPFVLNEEGTSAELHLVRSNPIARLGRKPLQVRLAVSGPHSYVSPDWYGIEDQVPTWNYVAVHLIGELEPLPVAELEPLLARQSAFFESRLAPKRAWTMDKMTEEARGRLMRMILPYRLNVLEVDGTWKLGQNKDEAARLSAASEMQSHGFGTDRGVMARLMRDG